MASEPVHPLRINKGTPASSPSKMAGGLSRPLSEISPMEKRRNSPSWYQPTSPPKKPGLNTDSSPFQSSPLETAPSPRMFWQNRNNENMLFGGRSGSPSPTRRSSIERLQRASRVKNSNILALEQKQEYDPTRLPQIERPLSKVQGNSFRSSVSSGLRSPDSGGDRTSVDFDRSGSFTSSSVMSPRLGLDAASNSRTPSKDQASPTKSSMSPSKLKGGFDHDTSDWTGDFSLGDHRLPEGHSLHRHAKSVTFDAAPPQVNEYEMATPDLSSIGTNSREGSYDSVGDDDDDDDLLYDPANIETHDDSFDASLEDTAKTPVVGPDEWRGDSPMISGQPPQRWAGSPMPEATPSAIDAGQATDRRSNSTNSNGEHRPLPPLPGAGHARSQSSDGPPASPGLSATAERLLGAHRSLPSPPPATTTKSDIQNIGNGRMTLEERLKLMMMSDDNGKTAAELQRERRLRRGNGRDRAGSPVSEAEVVSAAAQESQETQEADETLGDISALDDYQLPAKISRESIMRRVNGNKDFERESDYNFSSPAPSSSPQRSPTRSPERHMPLDPDVPIPSTEGTGLDNIEEEESSVIINRDAAEQYDEDDVYELYQDSEEDQGNDSRLDEDDGSHYSDHNDSTAKEVETAKNPEPEGLATPRPPTPTQQPTQTNSSMGDAFPDLGPSKTESGLSRDLEAFMLPMPTESETKSDDVEPKTQQRPTTPERSISKPEYDGSGWGEPEDDDEYADDTGSPGSVIHHPASDGEDRIFEDEPRDSPAIPERIATVKASGSKLKTRVSNTPTDLAAMREARRQVSQEVPDVPPIPQKHRDRLSRDASTDQQQDDEADDGQLERQSSFKNRSLKLDLDLGLSLDQDFERVIEAQKVEMPEPPSYGTTSRQVSTRAPTRLPEEPIANKTPQRQRGYLMRQNTKVVAATDKDGDDSRVARSAGNSPVKERPQSWVVEPWNGKMRKSSVRKHTGSTTSSVASGPAPPMPGQQSNATALKGVVEEEEMAEQAPPETGERGRLFIKVMGVKDLDLPIPKHERTFFSLTLDNGVHCVTTAWLELARNAPIGQEFELVVPNDLEFQLTLNVKLDKPAPIMLNTASTKLNRPKTSTLSRVFASPKKRKELEIRQREEEERYAQQQRDAQARQRNASPSSYELLSPLAAEDGSFARSYVCLKEHEHRCFGRPYMAEIACFNEWATEEAGFASSVKSKRGNNNVGVVRRAPYKIGKLEVQLLFVPRPKNTTDDDMPKSMNSCIRELKATEERLSRNWEGHLSQQGGDCPYWRRRYFKLVGAKLTAYHEATRQPRASINLSNAKRLIDDRRSLTEKETLVKGGRRRRSAFAEEEEGYMFVEEGFRIRFNNGEVIDFYADTAEDKEGWMKVLSEVIGREDSGLDDDPSRPRSRAKWCELVLKREEQLRRRSEARRVSSGRRVHSRTKSMFV